MRDAAGGEVGIEGLRRRVMVPGSGTVIAVELKDDANQGWCSRKKRCVSARSSMEFPVTPGTGCQSGAARLAVLSSPKPSLPKAQFRRTPPSAIRVTCKAG